MWNKLFWFGEQCIIDLSNWGQAAMHDRDRVILAPFTSYTCMVLLGVIGFEQRLSLRKEQPDLDVKYPKCGN